MKVGKQMEAVNALSNEERREGHQCTGDDIVYECNKDILIDKTFMMMLLPLQKLWFG